MTRNECGRIRQTSTGLALLAIVGTLSGCGVTRAVSQPAGKALFAQDCSACHSLSGRESPRRQGGDLLDFHSNRAVMLQFASEMPVRHRLGPVQLRAVADYVIAVERRGS
jgi:mono/diheme cytochrome c family protein